MFPLIVCSLVRWVEQSTFFFKYQIFSCDYAYFKLAAWILQQNYALPQSLNMIVLFSLLNVSSLVFSDKVFSLPRCSILYSLQKRYFPLYLFPCLFRLNSFIASFFFWLELLLKTPFKFVFQFLENFIVVCCFLLTFMRTYGFFSWS